MNGILAALGDVILKLGATMEFLRHKIKITGGGVLYIIPYRGGHGVGLQDMPDSHQYTMVSIFCLAVYIKGQ